MHDANGGLSGGQVLAEGVAWGAIHRLLSVQIFGAEEATGRELAVELLRAGHPLAGLQLCGAEDRVVAWKGHRIQVHDMTVSESPADLAFVCTDRELGAELVPRLLAVGTRVIDLSGASKANLDVPLVVGGAGTESMGPFTQLVALPSRSSVALCMALRLLDRAARISAVDVCAFIAAVSEGTRGVKALRDELGSPGSSHSDSSARRVGNLQPALGERPGSTPLEFESEIAGDIRRILERSDLGLDLCALEGSTERCDAFVVRVTLETPLDAAACAAQFRAAPGFRVHDGGVDPLPQACAATEEIHVGRIRAGSGAPGSLCFFLVADQLRAGAATVALRVGAHLLAGGP